jgi:hypothetical protein
MATKKKTKKKTAVKSKKTAGKKLAARKVAPKKRTPPKKLAKKKSAARKLAPKKKSTAARTTRDTSGGIANVAYPRERSLSGEESGDLQGLSNVEGADSESVDELLEEGNAFEAGIVSGVEEADDSGVREVHTREVLEDDVPAEYLDED